MAGGSLELYRTFWQIGRCGNLTRAAEALCVTQPSVSLALKALEAQLGATLCVRSQRGVALTREGQVFHRELEKVFAGVQAAERKLEKLVSLESGSVAISASDTTCTYFLLPYLDRFRRLYPGVRLEITNRTSDETAALLKAGEADLGFVSLPYRDPELETTACLDLHDVLIAGSGYRELLGHPVGREALGKAPLILLERKSAGRRFLEEALREQGGFPEPVMELGSVDLIIELVRGNFGVGFIPLELCGDCIDGVEIFQVELAAPLPPRGLGLAEVRGFPLSHAATRFKELIL